MGKAMVAVALGVLAWAGIGTADAPAPVGARSGFTEGPGTLSPGGFVLEVGSSYLRASCARNLALGESVLHIPAGARAELQACFNSYVMSRCPDGDSGSMEDACFGLKTALTKTVNMNVGLTVPVSREGYRERAFQPKVRLIAAGSFGGRYTLAGNLNYVLAREEEGRYHQASVGVWLGAALSGRTGVYLEGYGFSSEERGGDRTAYAQGGLTCLVNNNLALDLHAGRGIRPAGGGYSVGIGLARQFNTGRGMAQ